MTLGRQEADTGQCPTKDLKAAFCNVRPRDGSSIEHLQGSIITSYSGCQGRIDAKHDYYGQVLPLYVSTLCLSA